MLNHSGYRSAPEGDFCRNVSCHREQERCLGKAHEGAGGHDPLAGIVPNFNLCPHIVTGKRFLPSSTGDELYPHHGQHQAEQHP